jgi:hypothetical protein
VFFKRLLYSPALTVVQPLTLYRFPGYNVLLQ